jgi:tetratricopeptide (TPR) repeat protein
MNLNISAEKFFEKYKAVLSEEQYNRFEDFTLGISKSLNYSDKEIVNLDMKLEERNKFTEKLYKTASRNNEGIALEKKGDLDAAIKIYEENIEDGYPATHSFERLMIIYKKLKRFNDEIRIIELGISTFEDVNRDIIVKWQERLIRAKKDLQFKVDLRITSPEDKTNCT